MHAYMYTLSQAYTSTHTLTHSHKNTRTHKQTRTQAENLIIAFNLFAQTPAHEHACMHARTHRPLPLPPPHTHRSLLTSAKSDTAFTICPPAPPLPLSLSLSHSLPLFARDILLSLIFIASGRSWDRNQFERDSRPNKSQFKNHQCRLGVFHLAING